MNKLPFLIIALITSIVSFTSPSNAIEFSVFSDIALHDSDSKEDNSNFALGSLDLFASNQISEKTFVLAEVVFENDGQGYIVDVERLWIKHAISDQIKISAGRFHSPLGYWNSTMHHGTLLQDTVSRPFFLEFEDDDGGILPLHSVGVRVNGLLFSDTEEWKYNVILSNGPSLNSSDFFSHHEAIEIEINDVSDKNDNKSIAARVTYSPEDNDWALGVFTNMHNINESSDTGIVAKGDTLIKQKIYGADFQWEVKKFNLLAELFILQHDDKAINNEKHDSFAFYVQAGYKIKDNLKIIYRYSDLNFESNDSYYQLLNSQEQSHHVMTLRFDFDDYNTLKFEYNKQLNNNPLFENINNYSIQWSFMLP